MIDRRARQELIRITKDFVGGRITNYEFENQFYDDLYLDDDFDFIFRYGLWTLYSDHREYKRVGEDKLSREDRKFAAQMILFLQSDFKYRWPALEDGETMPRLGFAFLYTLGLTFLGNHVFEFFDLKSKFSDSSWVSFVLSIGTIAFIIFTHCANAVSKKNGVFKMKNLKK